MTGEAREHLAAGERAGQRYALQLPRVLLQGSAGVSVAKRAGSSLEFRDYRDYQPGDDLRHIDWNAYARSDVLSVKMFREEVTPHLDLLVDDSRSMALEDTAKAGATRGLAALFAAAATNAGFSCVPWRIGAAVEPVENGTLLPTDWQGLGFSHGDSPAAALAQGGSRWRPRGLRVLLSDLLFDAEPLQVLRHLAERASAVAIVQVLAAVDDRPALEGNLRLLDSETGLVREINIDEAAVQRYCEALRRHQDNWNAACRQTGAVFSVVIAEDVVRDWRLDDLVAAEVLKVR